MTTFAQVVLHRRVPSRFESFTYRVPDGQCVRPGQFVTVSFKKQELPAVVRYLHSETPPYHTKPLAKIFPFVLPEIQRDLADWMGKQYQCSAGKVLDPFVPENIWKNPPEFPPADNPKNTVKAEKKLFIENSKISRNEMYADFLKNLSKKGHALILLPEQFHLQKCAAAFPMYHGGLKEKEKADLWSSILRNEISVVAGTRAALFLPFQNLEMIILDFEENESYLEKRSPKYHAFEVAERLAELCGAKLFIVSAAPRVEAWWKMAKSHPELKGHVEFISASHEILKRVQDDIEIVDMADERRRGNDGIFSQAAIEAIASGLAKNQQALLALNRKGEAGALLCRDCGFVFRCGTCASALTVHASTRLRCSRCKIERGMPLVCEKCDSANLKTIGFGTERLERDIKKIFGKAKVLRLEGNKKNGRAVLRQAQDDIHLADIIIATKIIDKPLELPRLDTVVAVNPDPLLHMPDFRASERVFQQLSRYALLGKKLIIQTLMPTHPVFVHLANNEMGKFYEEELEARKSLSLPPFGNNKPVR